jgi:hypothetical protein
MTGQLFQMGFVFERDFEAEENDTPYQKMRGN